MKRSFNSAFEPFPILERLHWVDRPVAFSLPRPGQAGTWAHFPGPRVFVSGENPGRFSPWMGLAEGSVHLHFPFFPFPLFFVLFCCGVTPQATQGLFPALHSGISPCQCSGDQMGCQGSKPGWHMQASVLPAVLPLQSHWLCFLPRRRVVICIWEVLGDLWLGEHRVCEERGSFTEGQR